MKNYKKFSKKGNWGVKQISSDTVIIEPKYSESEIELRRDYIAAGREIFFNIKDVATRFSQYVELNDPYEEEFYFVSKEDRSTDIISLKNKSFEIILSGINADCNYLSLIDSYYQTRNYVKILRPNNSISIFDIKEKKYVFYDLYSPLGNRVLCFCNNLRSGKDEFLDYFLFGKFNAYSPTTNVMNVCYDGKKLLDKEYADIMLFDLLFCNDKNMFVGLINENNEQAIVDLRNPGVLKIPFGNHNFQIDGAMPVLFDMVEKIIYDVKLNKIDSFSEKIEFGKKTDESLKAFCLKKKNEFYFYKDDSLIPFYSGKNISEIRQIDFEDNKTAYLYFIEGDHGKLIDLNGKDVFPEKFAKAKAIITTSFIILIDENIKPLFFKRMTSNLLKQTVKEMKDSYERFDATSLTIILKAVLLGKYEIIELLEILAQSSLKKDIKECYEAVWQTQLVEKTALKELQTIFTDFFVSRKPKDWSNLFSKMPKDLMKKYVKEDGVLESDLFNVWK